jgi:hypothetical protein
LPLKSQRGNYTGRSAKSKDDTELLTAVADAKAAAAEEDYSTLMEATLVKTMNGRFTRRK